MPSWQSFLWRQCPNWLATQELPSLGYFTCVLVSYFSPVYSSHQDPCWWDGNAVVLVTAPHALSQRSQGGAGRGLHCQTLFIETRLRGESCEKLQARCKVILRQVDHLPACSHVICPSLLMDWVPFFFNWLQWSIKYNWFTMLLVSAVQRSESAVCIHIYIYPLPLWPPSFLTPSQVPFRFVAIMYFPLRLYHIKSYSYRASC